MWCSSEWRNVLCGLWGAPPPHTQQPNGGAGSRAVECPPSRQLRKYDPVPATGTGPGTTVSREQLTESPATKLTHFLPAITSHWNSKQSRSNCPLPVSKPNINNWWCLRQADPIVQHVKLMCSTIILVIIQAQFPLPQAPNENNFKGAPWNKHNFDMSSRLLHFK